MARVLLLSEATLKSNSIVNNNLDSKYIQQEINEAQDDGLEPIIGTKLYNKLMDLVDTGDITGATDYKYLLDEYITPYLLNKTLSGIYKTSTDKVSNMGIVQLNGSNVVVPSQGERDLDKNVYEGRAGKRGIRLKEYLMANRDKYPEFGKATKCYEEPGGRNTFNCPINLSRQ